MLIEKNKEIDSSIRVQQLTNWVKQHCEITFEINENNQQSLLRHHEQDIQESQYIVLNSEELPSEEILLYTLICNILFLNSSHSSTVFISQQQLPIWLEQFLLSYHFIKIDNSEILLNIPNVNYWYRSPCITPLLPFLEISSTSASSSSSSDSNKHIINNDNTNIDIQLTFNHLNILHKISNLYENIKLWLIIDNNEKIQLSLPINLFNSPPLIFNDDSQNDSQNNVDNSHEFIMTIPKVFICLYVYV